MRFANISLAAALIITFASCEVVHRDVREFDISKGCLEPAFEIRSGSLTSDTDIRIVAVANEHLLDELQRDISKANDDPSPVNVSKLKATLNDPGILITPKTKREVPPAFGNPSFGAKFSGAFNVDKITLSVLSFTVTHEDEDEMEVYYHFGFQTSEKTSIIMNKTIYEEVKKDNKRSVKGANLDVDVTDNPTLIFQVYEEDGEALRTETLRTLDEFGAQRTAGLSIEMSNERISALQAKFYDWAPVVDWVVQAGMWVWSWFTRANALTPDLNVSLLKNNAYLPTTINGITFEGVEVRDLLNKKVSIPGTESDVDKVITAMKSGAHLLYTLTSHKDYCRITYRLDILYSKN